MWLVLKDNSMEPMHQSVGWPNARTVRFLTWKRKVREL
jgi:hypothetical protein